MNDRIPALTFPIKAVLKQELPYESHYPLSLQNLTVLNPPKF